MLVRTVARLRPAQLAHRMRLRGQRAALTAWPAMGRRLLHGAYPAIAGWPNGFWPVDARAPTAWPEYDALREGELTLLGVTRRLGEPPDWRQVDEPLLWRF